jgi:NADPH-dependent 2,4-dienoyl-CoA reductase/sulfur reductase-like enzyme
MIKQVTRASQTQHFDVLVAGAGPAGMAAAYAAAQSRARVGVVDDNSGPGGQIWRGLPVAGETPVHALPKQAAEWNARFSNAKIAMIFGAKVFAHPEPGILAAETWQGSVVLDFRKLVLATGARERFLPFPGWTLPGVMGAGGLQALVKSGMPIRGARVVIAGTGPLLLAVADYMRHAGARILLIAEQAPANRVRRFATKLLRHPAKAWQAAKLRASLAGVPYRMGTWPIAAGGTDKLEWVEVTEGKKTQRIACDYLACGFHLVPNTELAALLGCQMDAGCVHVDDLQETSVEGVYCAGEPTGIGGLEKALVEGEIAGYAAAGDTARARQHFTARAVARGFASALEETFALRAELRSLAAPETLVCRCEDVPLKSLERHKSWRDAKLQTRCGMGPCQGRVCGPAVEFLFGWSPESVRPPIFPARLESFIAAARIARDPAAARQ